MIHQPMSYGSGYSQASDMELDTKEILSLKRKNCTNSESSANI
jgi:ATP-dependent protease ClpP protease subunit